MSRPLRIAMIGQRGIPASFGGVERVVEALGERLVQRGHEVSVYCRDGYGPSSQDLPEWKGMQRIVLPTLDVRGVEAALHSGLSAAHALRQRYDVVHYHALGPGVFSSVTQVASGAAVVQTIHGFDDERAKWSGPAKVLLKTGRFLSSRVPDATVVVSRTLRQAYWSQHRRIATYIPNGVERLPRTDATDEIRRLGLEPGRYILFVGRFVPEKRPELLVEAFRGIADPALRLVLAGGSNHTDEFLTQLQTAAAADPRVVLPGYVYGETLAQLYSHAGVFVLPSDLEGLPLVLLEAIAYGLPVIASDIGPHVEVVGRSGPGHRLFPRGDVAALRAQLEASFANREGAAAGARALRCRVLEEHDWDRATDETEALYRRLVNRR